MTLQAFTQKQLKVAHDLLAGRVAIMYGRKLEEADWERVYCGAKNIPESRWSNLNIDVMHNGLGVEHKMMCVRKRETIKEYCGTSLMHPAATRSIRVGSLNRNPNKAARDILQQYSALIASRKKKVAANNRTKHRVDMRTGWLLWQMDLDEFLYFEEPMSAPLYNRYFAEWNERPARGARKATKNLWIYEKASGKKRYSVTTEAGAKIQPYFDVPSPNDKNLYYFRVQGELQEGGRVKVWITSTTALCFSSILGKLDSARIDTELKALLSPPGGKSAGKTRLGNGEAVPIVISQEAYSKLKTYFPGVSDELMMQRFADYMFNKKLR